MAAGDAWRLDYSDGSANRLVIWQDGGAEGEVRFRYEPVTPERSSSGSYSGGEPAQGVVPLTIVAAMWQWIRALAADPSLRTDMRMKGSGQFVVAMGGEEDHFRVVPCPLLQDFDRWLDHVLGLRGRGRT